MASVVDRPKEAKQDDLLKIGKYTNGLIEFIKHSETPITIGVQGEWGSGKTSLLNTIREDLCNDNAKFYSIWLNTWEYSLLSEPDETLIKIISGLVQEIGALTQETNKDKGKRATAALGSLIKNFGGFAGGLGGKIAELTGEKLEEYMTANPLGNSIKELRVALQEVINEAIKDSNKESFIFFIDDLDRLDPAVAVNILELIKNLFDLEKCIFVLAIDYSVVVKGLQSKFGVMTEENEWEFRAFFDKIIQLPFSMPISSYDVSIYLKSHLIKVNYFEKSDLDNDEILDKIVEIVGLSVGTNPRALVRLANSVGLMEIIRGKEKITSEARVIEFALVCIQVAYPIIYEFIQKKPDFTTWDKQFSMEILKNKKIDSSDLDTLKTRKEFNEDWEQNLWKICQINTFLKQNVFQLSDLLNFIKDNLPKANNETIDHTLNKLLSMSSITSVSAKSVVSENKRTKYTRLSPQKKQVITNNLQNIINERVKSKHPDYFSNQADFKIYLKGDKRNVWLPVKMDDFEFDLCVWTNHRNITMYVNSEVSNDKTITWFKENMGEFYTEMKFDRHTKDGKKVVVLDGYPIKSHTEATTEYENAIESTFNKFLLKVNT